MLQAGGHCILNSKFPDFYRFSRPKSHIFSLNIEKDFEDVKENIFLHIFSLLVAVYLITISEHVSTKKMDYRSRGHSLVKSSNYLVRNQKCNHKKTQKITTVAHCVTT